MTHPPHVSRFSYALIALLAYAVRPVQELGR